MHIVSMIPGRIRLRDKSLKSGYIANRVIHRIRHIEPRLHVHYEHITGSILLTYDAEHIGEGEIANKLTENFYVLRALTRIPGRYKRIFLHSAMLVSLIICIVSIIYKKKKIHTLTGIAFTAVTLFHMRDNKKRLMR